MSSLRYKVLRCIAYSIELMVFYILCQVPYLLPPILGVRPVLLIPIALTIAVLEDQRMGLAFGIAAGLLIDLGMGSVLGFHALLLGLICYAVGFMAVNLVHTNILTALIVALLAVGVIFSLQCVFYYYLRGYGYERDVFIEHYLPIMLYTFIPTPVFYYFNKAFATGIREKD